MGHGIGHAFTLCQRLYAGDAKPNWPQYPKLDGDERFLEVYAGNTLVKRFMNIDKMSTAMGTSDGSARSYRYGYGVIDLNLNGKVDPGERRVYFEISDYSTSYIFYEAP